MTLEIERSMSEWGSKVAFDDIPDDVVELMKTLVFVIGGCTVAGGTADGCEAVVDLVRSWGGQAEATVLVHGGKAPAHNVVLANSVMARAYDICDFVPPGMHMGTSAVPVALATAEMTGGRSGKDLIAALAVGCEIGTRFGKVSRLDGFDPTGVGTVFTTAAVAGRMLRLDPDRMLHALALAFNRSGGSFQSNIDGSLAVRLIQGFASQNGIVCAQLAAKDITGPANFIDGVWGYYHLFCNDERDDQGLAGDLGERWDVRTMGFKKYPSCGGTLAATDAALALTDQHRIDVNDIASITVRMTDERAYYLVGSDFAAGANPTVNGQFNVAYCVANAIMRGFPDLAHFTPEMVTDASIIKLIERITVVYDPSHADGSHSRRASVEVSMVDGAAFAETVDSLPGGARRPLGRDQLIDDFWSRSAFGGKPIARSRLEAFLSAVEHLEDVDDVRTLVPYLVASDRAISPEYRSVSTTRVSSG